ncbi:hypothetical protein KKY68_06715 [Pseudomonas aeruginosa]|uniref:DUF6367 family protein n=1 Tax=Allopusillimonas ginsengisoli TaxID=453575 RepID=UPI00101FF503|nr:DUF6367 family protein [Allopusillimonas ginsengisoli]TEA71829.1 hypothetical protein ERE07_19980 [Allopusillimonas ginsengisoli]WCU83888.1 hypothetical protein KKY68_06715 [Pseudomonas aeruginosa]
MKLADILREMDAEPSEISVLVSSDALLRCNLEIALESIWVNSGYKDWMYRVDPEDPRLPLQRHIHIAKKKHTSAKNMQASWNADGTRHDKKSFNTSVGDTTRVREIARNVLSISPEIALESIDAPRSDAALIDEISFSSDGSEAYVALRAP